MSFAHLFQLLTLLQVLNLASCVDVDCSGAFTYQTICKNRTQKPVRLILSKPNEALESLCSKSSATVECLKAHVNRCPTLAPPGGGGSLDTDSAAIEKEESESRQYCENDNFRSDFVKHSRCLKATLYCTIHVKTAMRQLEELNLISIGGNDGATAAVVNKICGALDKYDSCVSFVVKTMCLEESREFSKEYAMQVAPPVSSVLCAKNEKLT